MSMHLDLLAPAVSSRADRTAGAPDPTPVGHAVLGGVFDAEVPLFSLVRMLIGLPTEDRRWWPEEMLPAVHLEHPTIDLLERTLAGLRGHAQRRTPPHGGRHARR